MRAAIILITMVFFIGCQNIEKQTNIMNDTNKIQQTISNLFVNTDNKNWKEVEELFASKVTLDYSSMTGNPASEITPNEITTGWKTVLPGFEYTHHQIGNFITKLDGNKAHSFCYGTATHYLKDENGNIWTVVGSYDFILKSIENNWKITSMKFNYKYQDGNNMLIQKAIDNAKSN